MKQLRNITALLLIVGCFPVNAQEADDGWLKRKWGDMIARYNIYFNATQKLDAAVADLATRQKDDFTQFLTVYPYGTTEDAKGMRESMDEVMKKASKVIQNRPRSKWADDAYFVIGQSHFFRGDYYAAIEAFQFVNSSFNDPEIKAMSQLWLMKSYMQQERYDDAEAILSLLKKIKLDDREFNTHRSLSGGDLLVKQKKYQEASVLYKEGLKRLKDKTLAYRTYFVLGQIYLNNKNYRKASDAFEKVQKLNAPYDYVFQANLGMAQASAETGGSGLSKTKKYLKRMLGDDKNIEYYDQIYYELAKLEFSSGNEDLGLQYMKSSAASSGGNSAQQAKTYLFLADYYFDARNYTKAQSYYDSTVAVLPKDYPDADKINAKHSVLSKLIQNIRTVQTQDSLLALARMDRDKLDKKIEQTIRDIEEKKREEAELLKIQQERDALNTGGGGPVAPSNAGGTWYFYNAASVGRGYNDFLKTWGVRQNTDWWRFINKSVTETAVPKDSDPDAPDADPNTYVADLDKDQQDALENIAEEKVEYYKNIPFSETAKEVAERKIEDAFMGNGKIYFDDLREFEKTKTNLETLLNRFSSTTHKPEALFYLARAEQELGNTASYDKYARQVQNEYPNSNYNKVLNAKEIVEDSKDREVIELYQKMFDAYESDNFSESVAIKKQIEADYPSNSIQAKIDYLYALIIGKTEGKDAYIKELEIVANDYAGNEVGEMADFTLKMLTREVVETAIPLSGTYNESKEGIHYYVVTGSTNRENEVQVRLDEFNRKYFSNKKFTISSLILGERQLYYVRQFKSSDEAMAYHKDFISGKETLEKAGLDKMQYYAISEANFKALVKEQNEMEYITFFNVTY